MSAPQPTLRVLLDEVAAADPEALATVLGSERLTFAELRERSARVAAGLSREGVQAGDVVAVWLPNCPAWIELQFALAELGALHLCVNTRYRSHDLGAVLSQARARWLVLQPEFRGIDFPAILADTTPEARRELEAVIVHGAEDEETPVPDGTRAIAYEGLRAAAPGTLATAGAPDSPCTAFASSGSTGTPKLIVHSQRGIAEHARAVATRFFDGGDATALVTLPLGGVFGHSTLMGALAAGRPSIVMDAFDADLAVELIERHAVTTTTGPDEMMLRILDAADPPERLASWREGGFGAHAVDSETLIARGDAAGVHLFQCYGSSECLGLFARQPRGADAADRRLGGGVPVSPRTRVRVRSEETGELVSPGTQGLLEITGPSLMEGYLHQAEATAAAFTGDGWFRTGDVGYLADDTGRFVFLTRRDDALRLAGFLVEPREIGEFIERLDSVAAAQVVEVPTEGGPRLVAFAIPAAGAEIGERAVVDHCAGALAKYKVPRHVFAIDEFPTTPSANGDKVQRARLRDLARDLLASPSEV